MIDAFRTIRGWHQPLAFFALVMAGLAVASAAGLVVDGRIINGAPGWAKPLKFSVSFALYALTLAWMTAQIPRPRWRRAAWWAGTVMAVVSVLEMAGITLQVVRGTMSHFNNSTPFDATLFNVMGALVALLYVATLVVAATLLRSPMRDASFTWALRLGLLIAIAGLSVGFLMLQATPEQLAQGDAARYSGAHSVGVTDGGPGLPLVGWSTTGGDLRIGHFVGMHGLQALPLLAMVLSLASLRRRLSERTRLQVVLLAAAGYAGVTALTVWQALRGQPLLAPDATTVTAAGALLALAALGATAIALQARRSASRVQVSAPELPSDVSVHR
jgi:uncharacterized membrane protein YhaH (DUF805 family)